MKRVAVALTCALMLCTVPGWSGDRKRPPGPAAVQADQIVIVKSDRKLTLLRQGQVLRTYKVALGTEPKGAKTRQGDNRTPEGEYTIDSRNAQSQYHLSLHISYPNADDRVEAHKAGVSAGGAVMIHGLPNGMGWIGSKHRLRDWTDGCIAVTNDEMDEIWRTVADGTPIEIRP